MGKYRLLLILMRRCGTECLSYFASTVGFPPGHATILLQDEIADRVVATGADPYGVLTRSMVAAMDAKPPETLTPHRLSCASFFINSESARKITCRRASLSSARSSCNAGTRTPGPRWHSCASMRTGAFNPQPNSLDRALHAAECAVGLDPANQLAHYALAVAHYFRGDLGAFRAAAERAGAQHSRWQHDDFPRDRLLLLR